MATLKTLKRLARQHTECLKVHSDIKALIPERDALKLLHNGFTDCSWGNDMCPSYYAQQNPNIDPISIMVIDDIDDEYNRISDNVYYSISGEYDGAYISPTKNVDEAIANFKKVTELMESKL